MVLENRHIASDRDPYHDRLEGYLRAILQRDVLLKDWDGHGALPVFLTHLYKFFETRIGQTPLLFMFGRRADDNTPAEIRKHIDLAKPEFERIVVYSAERLAARFRARLVAAGVAFAVPGNQLFIPELASGHRNRSVPIICHHRPDWFCSSISSAMNPRGNYSPQFSSQYLNWHR